MPDSATDHSDSETAADRSNGAALRELPPSAKLVARTLHEQGELTQQELLEETLLPPRTVRNALQSLEEHEFVTSELSFIDARQRLYSLAIQWPGFTDTERNNS